MEAETKSLVFVSSDDEGTASDPINKNSGATIGELEEEIRELENTLKMERSERKRLQIAAQEEIEKEVIKAEEIWMERARQAIQVGRGGPAERRVAGERRSDEEDTADGGAAGLDQTGCQQGGRLQTGDGGVEEQDEESAGTCAAGVPGDNDGEGDW